MTEWGLAFLDWTPSKTTTKKERNKMLDEEKTQAISDLKESIRELKSVLKVQGKTPDEIRAEITAIVVAEEAHEKEMDSIRPKSACAGLFE